MNVYILGNSVYMRDKMTKTVVSNVNKNSELLRNLRDLKTDVLDITLGISVFAAALGVYGLTASKLSKYNGHIPSVQEITLQKVNDSTSFVFLLAGASGMIVTFGGAKRRD
jgi:hypothetical protein